MWQRPARKRGPEKASEARWGTEEGQGLSGTWANVQHLTGLGPMARPSSIRAYAFNINSLNFAQDFAMGVRAFAGFQSMDPLLTCSSPSFALSRWTTNVISTFMTSVAGSLTVILCLATYTSTLCENICII